MSAAEARFLPGADVNVPHNVTNSEFVYYRVYHRDGAIATKRPAYLDDIYIGRIRCQWVTPPHTAGSLKRCLTIMENIDPNQTTLFPSGSNQSALANEAPISLTSSQTLGIIPEDPVILFSKAMPRQAERQPGLRVAPDRKSPVAPRFLFYGVYNEDLAETSKAPIDPEQPWVSKIDLNSIMPPVSVSSLLHIICVKEGVTFLNTFPQLLAQDGLTPLGDDPIFTKDGNWLGASAKDRIVLKLGRPPFEQRSRYKIQNCCTGNLLTGSPIWRSKILISSPKSCDGQWKHFTILRLGVECSVNIYNRHTLPHQWHHRLYLIPSTTKNYFFICKGDHLSRKAFYDAGVSDAVKPYTLTLAELDTTDTRQMWSFIPVVGQPGVSLLSRVINSTFGVKVKKNLNLEIS